MNLRFLHSPEEIFVGSWGHWYNIHIFFRFQEIAGALDYVLITSSLVPVQNSDPGEANML